jgi:hypothetical protein
MAVSAMTWDRLGMFVNTFCASEAMGAGRVNMMYSLWLEQIEHFMCGHMLPIWENLIDRGPNVGQNDIIVTCQLYFTLAQVEFKANTEANASPGTVDGIANASPGTAHGIANASES